MSVAVTLAHLFAAPYAADGAGTAASRAAEPVRVSVSTPLCADEKAFWRALARRSPRIRPASAGEVAPVVEIGFVREGRRIVGRMRVALERDEREVGGNSAATRTVAGASCDEVVAAMSLMTALVFDADATSESTGQAQPVPATNDAAVAVAPPGESLERSAADEPPGGAPAAPGERRWSWSGGAQGLVSSEGAWGGGLFVELQRVSPEHRVGAWLPAFRIGGAFSSLAVIASPARAAVEWRVAQVDACPWRVALFRWWTLRPCAAVEGGVLDISADGVANARSMSRPWIAAAARIRSTWTPVDPIDLGIEAASVFPLVRDDFRVAPSLSLFQAPTALLGFGTFVSVRFL